MPGGAGEVLIAGVPSYAWHDGCGPTATGMIVGYYDTHGCVAARPRRRLDADGRP